MPLLEGTTNQVLECVLEGKSDNSGKPVVNVFHFVSSSPNVTPDKNAIIVDFASVLTDFVRAILHTTYKVQRYRCRFVDNPLDPYLDVGSTAAGTATGDATSTDLAIFYAMRTGIRGRSYNGSKHFSPTTEDLVTGDRLTRTMGVIPAVLTTLRDKLLLPIHDTTAVVPYSPCVLSPTLSVTPLGSGGIFVSGVTQVLLNDTTGTMRHRREKTAIAP